MRVSAFVVYSKMLDGAFVCTDFAEVVRSLAVIIPQGKALSEFSDEEITITVDDFDEGYLQSLNEYAGQENPTEEQ